RNCRISSISKVARRISSRSPASAISVSIAFPFLQATHVYASELPLLSERRRVTKYVEVRIDRVVSDRFQENRTALPAIRQEPAPEVGTLVRSPDCSPSAAEEREVQKENRVRRTTPELNSVIRP